MGLDTSLDPVKNRCADMKLFNQEVLRLILLDTRYRHISTLKISKGSINQCLAHPRDIFRPVIGQSAFAFVLVHNLWAANPTVGFSSYGCFLPLIWTIFRGKTSLAASIDKKWEGAPT
jgi:hypothetical protein